MVAIAEIKRKICLIGDWGVGKTSLIKKFVLDQFDDNYLVTLGTKVTKKRIKYKKDKKEIIDLNMVIWDIMGQKHFKSIQSSAYRGSNGALIVCDITRLKTLENLKTWREEIYKVAGKIPIVILANKIDLEDQRRFTHDDLAKMANSLKADYFFTSAKTGQNVENAFLRLGQNLI
jgi:small GTP-binding protein